MIQAVGLTKRYGDRLAVDHADFSVEPGTVTGFLGPNGAGKSTTMRMILGLDRPTAGSVTIGGRPYRDLPIPLREVGALLDAKALNGGRTAYHHLACLARSNGIPMRRVEEVLGLVGLEAVARKRARDFSLGMGQRLGIAAALLGDPGTLLFDEPVNGLDPEGILWVRTLMKSLAAQGRTVFVSSHLMSEMALTADRVIVIGRGRIKADTTMHDFIAQNASAHVRVRSPDIHKLRELMTGQGWQVEARPDDDGALRVAGQPSEAIGDLAGENGVWLHELAVVQPSLEEAFMRLTADSVEYQAGGTDRDRPGSGRGAGTGAPSQQPQTPTPPPTYGPRP
jgi:ABC-2 type transport system ATP-binding protein